MSAWMFLRHTVEYSKGELLCFRKNRWVNVRDAVCLERDT